MNNRILYILLLMAVVMVCSCSSDSPYNFEPRLQTLPATDISRTEATLSGKCVKDKGVDMPSLWFSYGNDKSMSERQEVQADADGNVSMHLSSLNAGTTYYFIICFMAPMVQPRSQARWSASPLSPTNAPR